MKTIVLITRENNERVTHVAVYLCDNYGEARQFCRFMNRLTLEGGEKLVARVAIMNKEYSLEKYIPFTFDDITQLDDRTMQRVMRDLDSSTIATALKGAKNEVKEHFFRNMSIRATAMLKEDMEYMDPVNEEEIENARQLILDVYHCLTAEMFSEAAAAYKKAREEKVAELHDDELDLAIIGNGADVNTERDSVILVFRGSNGIANTVSVSLSSSYCVDNFCNFLNDLKLDKNSHIYAIQAKEMVEYETTKPMLTRFDEIFKYCEFFNEFHGTKIVRDTLCKFSANTLLQALKGLDKSSRELFLQLLPISTADEINDMIKLSDKHDKHGIDLFTLSQIRKAREKIINAVNRNAQKFLDGKLTGHEMLKG